MREKCEYFKGKFRYPVLRGLLQNLVELVRVRMRVLTRRLKQVLFTNKRVTVVLLGSKPR